MPPTPGNLDLATLRGRFLVFDGPDGSGKSTQFRRFADYVTSSGTGSRVPGSESQAQDPKPETRNPKPAVCEVREPGGTHIGERIRELLLDPAIQEEVDVRCEILLFMASRAQLVAQRIRPALQRGELVLADRFISSTLAYQGAAGGFPLPDILAVGQIALGQTWPDLTVIFDADEQTAASRLSPLLDRMELKGAAYHRKVRQGYLDQAEADPARHLVIDGSADADTVFHRLLEGLASRFS